MNVLDVKWIWKDGVYDSDKLPSSKVSEDRVGDDVVSGLSGAVWDHGLHRSRSWGRRMRVSRNIFHSCLTKFRNISQCALQRYILKEKATRLLASMKLGHCS